MRGHSAERVVARYGGGEQISLAETHTAERLLADEARLMLALEAVRTVCPRPLAAAAEQLKDAVQSITSIGIGPWSPDKPRMTPARDTMPPARR